MHASRRLTPSLRPQTYVIVAAVFLVVAGNTSSWGAGGVDAWTVKASNLLP